MKAAYASLISLTVLAVALSLFGRPAATSNPHLADTGDSIAATDTMPDRNPRNRVETADSTAETPPDSTCEEGVTRDAANFADGVIQAPEQPEAAAFAPTMMGDIEAASPTAGINIIAPPSANSRGTASLQYPFIMPPARNGMKPSLGLAYDSDAGDGVCGEGWMLPIPSITVDTRWGVPRYDMEHETETYLMDGQMLAMQKGDSLFLAHRHPGIERRADDGDTLRRFHPRTGTDFSLIERVGASPGSYHWRVTAPDGTLYTYGNGNAVLKDTITDISGNRREVVAEWLLSRIEEPHGDYITYHYHTTNDTVIGGLRSRAVCLDTIKAGICYRLGQYYKVDSVHTNVALHYRNRDGASMRTCSARYGFLTSSRLLLDSVAVTFRDTLLRSYGLRYSNGRFGMPLLSRVTHYDDEGNAASFQTFGYHDDVDASGGLVAPQGEAAAITAGDDGLDVDLILNLSDREPSLLGGSSTQSKSVSLYAGLGVWDGSRWKNNTIGASYEYSDDRTNGVVTLADIDGDGLPDKLFRKSDGLWYRPMQPSADGEITLGSPVKLAGQVGGFSSVKSHTSNIGVRGVAGLGDATFQSGWDWHSTKSRTTDYLADVNGDGMPDIVSNGKVWFNHLDTSGGTAIPTFTEGSHLSPNPITYTAAPDSSVVSPPTSEQLDSIAEDSPMMDVVRVWEAHKNGTVSIHGDIRNLSPSDGYDEAEWANADGVHVAIEKDSVTLWSMTIEKDDHVAHIPTGVSSINVLRGDRIYFRLQCGTGKRSNGAFDRVSWSPVIRYVSGAGSASPDGESGIIYDSRHELISNTGGTTSTCGASSMQLRGRMVKPATSDSVTFLAIATNDRVDNLGHPLPDFQTDTIFKKMFPGDSVVNMQTDTVIQNSHGLPFLRMETCSPTNVKWHAVKWTPSITCTDSLGKVQEVTVVPYVSAYTQTLQEPKPFWVGNQGDTMIVAPSLTMPTTANGKVSLVVKGNNRTWARKEYRIANGIMVPRVVPLNLGIPCADSVWVEFYWPDTLGVNAAVSCSTTVSVNGVHVTAPFTTGFHARRADTSMGLMHRGWGGFAYNAGNERFSHPIDERLLHAPIVEYGDTLTLDRLVFIPLSAKADTLGNLWNVGPSDDIHITEAYMGTARLGEQDVTWSNPISSDYAPATFGNGGGAWTGAPAPTLVSSSSGKTTQQQLNIIDPVPGFTKSSSSATTKGDVTFLDMNGDGYPDIIAGGSVQYTNTLGGMSGESAGEMPRPESSATSEASGMGGSPVNAASTIVSVVSGGRVSASGHLVSQLGKISVSISGNENRDASTFDFVDVNGDGLPDMVWDEDGTLTARLNLGYSFSKEVVIGAGHIQKGVSRSSNKSVSAGDSLCFGGLMDGTDVNKASASFSAGVGLASTISREEESLTDVNGDGLPDIVWTDTSRRTWARLNAGCSFAASPILMADRRGAWESTTHGESANAAFTVTVNVPVIHTKFSVNPGGAFGKSMTKTRTALRDIDADGFPDLVTSDSESGMSVRFSTIRRTNKLKTVTNSLGGTFAIDYAHSAPTYGLPGGKWVMSSVEVDRGIHFSGYDIPVTRTAFTYSGGVRDRREREFLGFAEVVSTNLDTENGNEPYRSVTDSFDVSSYYRRGLPLSTTLRDAEGNKYTETMCKYYRYSVKPDATDNLKHALLTTAPSDTLPVAYTPVKFTEKRNYEGELAAVKEQSGYTYDTLGCGEVAAFFYSSQGTMSATENGFSGYESRTDITHSSILSTGGRRYIGLPKSLKVWGSDGSPYRRDSVTYGTNLNAGKVASIIRNFSASNSDTTIVRFTYDGNTGNLKYVTQCAGNTGGGTYKRSYQYDEDYYLNTYPKYITDPHELETQISTMNLRYGLPTKIKDPNGNYFCTIYDGLGRLKSVKSPNEATDSSTIDMSYQPMAVMKADGTGIETPAHAVTTYHLRQPYETMGGLSSTHSDTMRVVTFVDGFGRLLQTRKEQVVDDGGGNSELLTVVDGTLEYDGMGRPIMGYYPAQQPAASLLSYDGEAQTGEEMTVTEYDVLDRPTKVTQPGRIITRHAYGVTDGLLLSTDTDPLGHKTRTYSDGAGRTVKTVTYRDASEAQPVDTRYLYDPMGRLTTVVNALGDSTHVSYDMLGRRTEVRHPASGTTRWTYDKLGNVLTEENEALRAQGEKIRYTWDVDRPIRMECPDDTVTYHYDKLGNIPLTNTNGRLCFRLDRSGGTEYGYDAMGNVTYEKRTVVVPQKGHGTFETNWSYDAYGKLLELVYPGAENLVYRYNATGGLVRVYAGKEDSCKVYVSHIGYDRFGDRVRMVYGNGTVMRHAYNEQTRRLSADTLKRGTQTRFVRKYTYDKDGNVTRLIGSAPLSYEYNYGYDPQHRLTSSRQRFGTINNGIFATDSLVMSYDDLWRVTGKSQRLSQSNIVQHGTLNAGYDMSYAYDTSWGKHYQMKDVAETHYRTEGMPTAADSIQSIHSYSYDPNGNLAHESVARKRLNGDTTRNISERKLLWNGMNRLKAISENGYVSLYWYDADGNRTVKEHGGGEAVWVNSKHAGTMTDTVTCSIYPNPYININGNRWTKHYYIGGERIASMTGTISGGFEGLNATGNYAAGHDSGMTIRYDNMRQAQEDSIDSTYARLGVPYRAHQTNTRGDGWYLYLPAKQADENVVDGSDRGQGGSHPLTLGDGQVYYYHRDHLGSTMSVTDSIGNTVQQVEYTPWGEVFVERRFGTSGYDTPYLFNGKELDEETGLYYYGARYYDPKMSVWYSVDPLAEEYKNISSYSYCHNNPINRIDEKGLADFFTTSGHFIKTDNNDKDPYIYIRSNNKNIKLSDYKFDKSKPRAMMRIVYHYAKAAGAINNKNVKIIGVDVKNTNNLDGSVLAYSIENIKSIRVETKNGSFDNNLAQIYNMICTISHEKFHLEKLGNSSAEEVQVLIDEMKMSEFKKTTESFKSGTIGYLQESLVNLYKENQKKFYEKIGEAKELMKQYGAKDTYKFINGGNDISF